MSPVPASPPDVSADCRSSRELFTWSHEPGLGILRFEGELDLAELTELGTVLAAADDPTRDLIVDLARLDFIDCAALACLFRLAGQMSRSGRRLVLRGDHGQVARLLDLTGFPTGVERLSDGPRLELVRGPRAREGSMPSPEGADVAA